MEKAEYIAKQRALLAEFEGTSQVVTGSVQQETAPLAGWFRVQPPRGPYKDYPELATVGAVGLLSYATELGKRGIISAATASIMGYQPPAEATPFIVAGMKAEQEGRHGDAARQFAEAIDRRERGGQWATQAEIDQEAKVNEAQAGAQWLPGQQPQPATGGFEPVV